MQERYNLGGSILPAERFKPGTVDALHYAVTPGNLQSIISIVLLHWSLKTLPQ